MMGIHFLLLTLGIALYRINDNLIRLNFYVTNSFSKKKKKLYILFKKYTLYNTNELRRAFY